MHFNRDLQSRGWDTTYYGWLETVMTLETVMAFPLLAAASLRDDIRSYLPELLPRFIGLFAEAERSGVSGF